MIPLSILELNNTNRFLCCFLKKLTAFQTVLRQGSHRSKAPAAKGSDIKKGI